MPNQPNQIHVLWEQLKMNGKEIVYTRMVEGGIAEKKSVRPSPASA